jgi:hypothetical protein
VITIYAALGFTLFGAFAGVLLTLRFWYGAMKKPGAVRSFISSLRAQMIASGNVKLGEEIFGDPEFPLCPLCHGGLDPASSSPAKDHP